ncbi:MAG: carboxypeptidase-like regulatory domain-containing protein, partial [Acidobacteriaceae bacterium]
MHGIMGRLASVGGTVFAVGTILSTVMAFAGVAGRIAGTVKDPAGNAVQNATILISEIDTGLAYRARTGSSGRYALPALPVGRYDLTVLAPGFANYKRKNITLDTDAILTLNVA